MKIRLFILSTLLFMNCAMAQTSLNKTEKEQKYYVIVEQMPVFKKGKLSNAKQYIENYIRYPLSAYENNKEGSVFASFVINNIGRVVDLEISKSVCPALDYEVLKAIASTDEYWTAGRLKNMPVNVKQTIKVEFRLEKGIPTFDDMGLDYSDLIKRITYDYSSENNSSELRDIYNFIQKKCNTKGWYYYNNLPSKLQKQVAKIKPEDANNMLYYVFKNTDNINSNAKVGNEYEEVKMLINNQLNDSIWIIGVKLKQDKMYLAKKKIHIGDSVNLHYKQIKSIKEFEKYF